MVCDFGGKHGVEQFGGTVKNRLLEDVARVSANSRLTEAREDRRPWTLAGEIT